MNTHPESPASVAGTCPVDHAAMATPHWEKEIGRFSKVPGSTRAAWMLSFGLPRAMFRAQARKGSLIARLQVDPGLRANPFPGYEDIRDKGIIVRGGPIAATATHSVATQILRSSSFGVSDGQAPFPPLMRRMINAVSDPGALGPIDPPSLLAIDPPLHTRYRKLVTRAFSAKSVTSREEMVQDVADRLLDRLERSGSSSTDLVANYTSLLPVAVICDILGVPEDMHANLLEWGNGAAASLDPGLTWKQYKVVVDSLRKLSTWFDQHVETLRRNPGDDLLSTLAQLDGKDRLTNVELRATGLLVLGAGFETTVNLMGNAVDLFAQHPDQLGIVRDDPGTWDNAIEEVLRYESPVQLTLRQAYVDAVIDEAGISAGESVILMLGGANRDPQVFDDPHTFDVTRANAADHLAFSSGAHYCLGASLARLEAVVGLRSLYERFPNLTVLDGGERRPTRVLRGWETLPVAVA